MEGDGLGLDFALLDIDLVTTQNDWNVLTNTDEVAWVRSLAVVTFAYAIVGYIRCQLGTFL
jgi:hypothetical protein